MSHYDRYVLMALNDPLNAFCRHTHVALAGRRRGPLQGLTMAVKDVFDIAGHRTGNGHPLWLETHPPAARTAAAVERLLEAGACLVGKTHADEMAYSLNGENVHYGTPTNPKAPGRIPGGSSSGSAAAVAGDLVDFALGTDCGGSVRLPASYCGIYGIRTSHGLLSADGVVKLAPSFDTVGWFARDAGLMRRIAALLLPHAPVFVPRRLLIVTDAFATAGPAIAEALAQGVETIRQAFGRVEERSVYSGVPTNWADVFRILQGAEIARQHGPWIDRHSPSFGPGIRERFAWIRTIDAERVASAAVTRARVTRHMDALLGDDALLILPTAPGIAPRIGTPAAELEAFRARAFTLLSIAGLARLPQVTLPLGRLEGCPLGLSLLAPRGRDRGLLDWIATHFV
jgi:amidase